MAKKSANSVERTTRKKLSPTRARDEAFEKAHAFLNKELFGGKLPNDITFNFQNKANSRGHFAPDHWGSRTDDTTSHEINLNPAAFTGRTDRDILSTLGHEMCHQYQHLYGTPGKRGYHNEGWAEIAKYIGLQPSSTGMVGGNETGSKMSHYIVDGGPFDLAYRKLAATGFKLPSQLKERRTKGRSKPNTKPKIVCGCEPKPQVLWGIEPEGWNCSLCGQPVRLADPKPSGDLVVGEDLPLAAETMPKGK
jgi:SprT-like family